MERFLNYFVPSHYDLDLQINTEKTLITATATIYGDAKTDNIKLHAVKLDIQSLTLDGMPVDDYLYLDDVLQIHNLTPGNHEIIIKYTAPITPDMEGVYLSTYEANGVTENIVATQFESHYARQCFPCVDEPAAKATFTLNISSADKTDTILSNMPIASEGINGNYKVVSFVESPKMSTYLVAFALGHFVAYETTSQHGVKITTYAGIHQDANDLKFAGDFAADVLDFYDNCFSTPFPLPKMDLLALPDFESGAMENWGLVTFREICLLCNESSSQDVRQYVAIVIAHELSHMWFGDLVTMAWWDDLWLNESFANMMEVYSTDKIRPELRAWEDFYLTAVLQSLQRDSLPGVQPVKVDVNNVEDISNLFDGAIVYGKGSHLLLMLMRAMGENNFFAGLKDYFAVHQYSNTTADDLWDALTPYASFNVREFMTPWLTQPGFPVVSDDIQSRFLITGETDSSQYPIMNQSDDLSGHYIIKLSDEELAAKISQLSSLNQEQKLRLLIDRRMLAKTDYVSSASLLPLVSAFAHETDSCIWDLVAAIISDLKIFFDPNTKEKIQFKKFVRNLAMPNYQRLGVAPRAEDTYDDIELRSTIMGMMLYSGDIDFVKSVENAYMDQDIKEVNADLRWIVGSTLVKAHDNLCGPYFEIYKATPDSALKRDLVDAISTTKNRKTALSLFDHLNDGTVRTQDRLSFYLRLLKNYLVRNEALDWMYQNWDWLYQDEGDKTIPEYPRYSANYIRKDGEAKKFKEFFDQHKDEKILSRDIAIAYSEIDARLALIAADQKAIFEYLKGLR
ncbi:M1 family metallopeptidase [Candidatus Saccharibacteria bacterium]|nr:M1 family metallopeptidase [Candidatus Saccharibacteria bacterium]